MEGIIRKENIEDKCKNAGTLYLIEIIPGIRKIILKNGGFKPGQIGKTLIESFCGGCDELADKEFNNIKNYVTEGGIYETIARMNNKAFNIRYFPT